MTVKLIAEGLKDIERFAAVAPDRARQSARLAINTVAGGRALKRLREAMDEEINFPTGYTKDKLYLASRATNAKLEATIAGRRRPTSLARFALPGQTPEGSREVGGVSVEIHRGHVVKMEGAFLVRLLAGKASDRNFANLGLALRLKPGDRVRNKKVQNAVQLDHNLYLLYGPSVDQAFQEVASDVTPEILDDVGAEFLRQFTRLTEDALA